MPTCTAPRLAPPLKIHAVLGCPLTMFLCVAVLRAVSRDCTARYLPFYNVLVLEQAGRVTNAAKITPASQPLNGPGSLARKNIQGTPNRQACAPIKAVA
ncbi:hypothetical protein GCM10022279_17390 [Comamonas faecalis]|uniref:Secreted protein n=1 Tax=Comamonas faecalis TaxID=1387849 RepID=A0ABP7R973_9BURK